MAIDSEKKLQCEVDEKVSNTNWTREGDATDPTSHIAGLVMLESNGVC